MKKTLTIASIIAATSYASAATISVNFEGDANLGPVGSDTPTQVVGVNGVQAQDWVNLSGLIVTSADIDAAMGSATLSYTTAFRFNTGSTSGTESHNLMDGAIRVGGTGDSNPVVAGLGTDYTSGGYDVYVYFGTDNHTRVHRFTLGGIDNSGMENATQAYNGTFTETDADGDRGNYMVFRGLTATGFTISDNGTSPGKPGIAGIEIVSVPEPSSAALLGLGGLALILRRRK